MSLWELIGIAAVASLSTALGVLVAWRRGFAAGRDFEFHLSIQQSVTRKMLEEIHSADYLSRGIANREPARG